MKRVKRVSGPTQVIGAREDTSLDKRLLLQALQRVKAGDFSVQLPTTWAGMDGKIADTFNDIVAANQTMAKELKRVGQVVGREGRTRERTKFEQAKGSWGEMETSGQGERIRRALPEDP